MAALLIAIFASVVGVGDYAPALRFYTSAAIISILTVFAVFAVIRTFGILIERLDKRLDKRHRDNIIPGIIFLLGLPTVLGLFFILYVSVIIDRLLPALFDYYGYPP